ADLDQTIYDIRSTIYSLQSSAASGPSLRAQLLQVATDATDALGFEPRLSMDGPVDRGVPEEIHQHLLAVLRESLSNAAKHAGATRVDVTVQVTATEVRLEVRDDGKGLPAGGRRSGLANMRKRAEDLGGTLEAASGDRRKGLTLTWRVP